MSGLHWSSRYALPVMTWLAASAIALVLAMNFLTASYVDGQFIPAGNDAFYHARRILDAAVGERGFYQFDQLIHVPEGSWLTWPWAYDFFMAQALRLALWVNPQLEPMAFLAGIPVVWLPINLGLLLLIAREMRLGIGLTSIALLAFALSPTTQLLHGVGAIDHHFVELAFTLASVWFGLRFFGAPDDIRRGVLLGFVLGIAPGFHNSLFILQIPILMCFAFMWIHKTPIEAGSSYILCLSMIVGCLAVLLPSEPFRHFHFEFATLSWFHLYVTVCTAVVVLFLSRYPFSRNGLLALIALSAVLVSPILFQVYGATAFLRGDTIRLDSIAEVASPLRMYLDSGRSLAVTRYYSWLIVFAPIILPLFCMRMVRSRDAKTLFFSAAVVFGLALMLMQFRLHPFGFWALLLGAVVLINELSVRRKLNSAVVGVVCLAALAILYQPPLRHQLFRVFHPGLSLDYAAARALYPILGEACKTDPGVALSYGDDGHPIRYHTECSVITNNFLLTEQHGDKVIESDLLLHLTPEQLADLALNVDYVFVRLYGVFKSGSAGLIPTPIDEVRSSNAPLFGALSFDEVPSEFQLLGELRVQDDRDFPYARVFKVVRTPSDLAGR